MAGKPVATGVHADIREGPPWVSVETRSDSTGWYQLEVPTGIYHVQLDNEYTSFANRDTVHIDGGRRRFDILRGNLEVRVQLPPLAEHRRLYCDLHSTTAGGVSARRSALVTDGQAAFPFDGIRTDVYYVRLVSEGGDQLWLPGTPNMADADRITVGGDRDLVCTGRLDRFASISGTVRGSWQEAQQDRPSVAMYGASGAFGPTSVHSDGSFSCDLLSAQPVKLQIRIGGVERWIGGTSIDDATVFTPEPEQEIQGVTWTESGISCRLEGPGERLFYRARVGVQDVSGHTFETDRESDLISICNLNPGRYWLHVAGYCSYNASEPWASQWYDGADSLEAATPIDVAEGQLARVTVHLVEGARIEGRVLTADGQPATGASVSISGPTGESLCDHWWSSEAGSFSFTGLGNGDYYVAARFNSTSWWYPGTTDLHAAVPIRIRNHTTVTGIEWRLPGS